MRQAWHASCFVPTAPAAPRRTHDWQKEQGQSTRSGARPGVSGETPGHIFCGTGTHECRERSLPASDRHGWRECRKCRSIFRPAFRDTCASMHVAWMWLCTSSGRTIGGCGRFRHPASHDTCASCTSQDARMPRAHGCAGAAGDCASKCDTFLKKSRRPAGLQEQGGSLEPGAGRRTVLARIALCRIASKYDATCQSRASSAQPMACASDGHHTIEIGMFYLCAPSC